MTGKYILWLASALAIMSFTEQANAQQSEEINFGDDTSSFANDGECDDMRFEGTGVASNLNKDNIARDATDCKTLYESGAITFSDIQFDPDATEINGIELGDNSYVWANDGQCDDARFIGEGMAVSPHPDAVKRDRDDCTFGLQIGQLTLADALPPPPESRFDSIDFGHDKGSYANDGECDDARFAGFGMANVESVASNIGGDRKDCLAAYKAGDVYLKANVTIDGFFFGDNQSLYASDGECDDPRFSGEGMATKPTFNGIEHDADDCMSAWQAGRLEPRAELEHNGILIKSGILFGDDSSEFAKDGECDDPRFSGEGMAASPGGTHARKDRTDCVSAFDNGRLEIVHASFKSNLIIEDNIRFGDDDSPFAKDGECDDKRFIGDAMSRSFRDEDAFHDASDCLAAYQDGTITLRDE